MNVPPYKLFFHTFKSKKMPGPAPLREFLIRDAEVPDERTDEAIDYIAKDATVAGLVRSVKGGDWIDLEGAPAPVAEDEINDADEREAGPDTQDNLAANDGQDDGSEGDDGDDGTSASHRRDAIQGRSKSGQPKKVFIAHGKNRTPLEQLKKALDQFKVKYAVAVDEANRGRPISKKVAELMENECSSGILIFTADERFLREKDDGTTEEVWRPSENVVYELGAARSSTKTGS